MARLGVILPVFALHHGFSQHALPQPPAIDFRVHQLMTNTGAKGLALAVIDEGQVVYVQAYGIRNGQGDPLQTNTVTGGWFPISGTKDSQLRIDP